MSLWSLVVMAVGLAGTAGCWSDPALVDDAFTPDQWRHLQQELALPVVDPCDLPGVWTRERCDAAAVLGQQLFFEPALSSSKMISCVTCHDPGPADKPRWFVDRREDAAVSRSDTGWTRRNTLSVVNVGLAATLAPPDRNVFTWTGKHATPGAVLELALEKAMGQPAIPGSFSIVAAVIRSRPGYAERYRSVFGAAALEADDATVFHNLEVVFEAYLRRLDSVDAPFDRYLAGDPDAIDDSAKRGFAVFVGRGTCIECHRGPAFTDFQFHSIGVPQVGTHVVSLDAGRFEITGEPSDTGRFRTSSLRNLSETAPYMHDGAFATLDEVIWFYRDGGGTAGYVGDKDARLEPLEISDDDAHDLEAFLKTLTGAAIAKELRVDLRPITASSCAP